MSRAGVGLIVDVTSRRRMRGVRAERVATEARRLLRLLGKNDAELSIALVGDEEMRRLNACYRGKDGTTDVLAFPAGHDVRATGNLLGDVVICSDAAARQAAERGATVAEELRVLLVHGVLHLLGYDHERSRHEARRMFGRQSRLVAKLASVR